MFLIDIIDHFISGDWGEEAQNAESPKPTYCIRGADINNVNAQAFDTIPLRYIAQSSFNTRQLQSGDIIIEKSGGSPTQSTGRVAFISQKCIDRLRDIVCSNFCAAFRVKEDWNPKYVFYYIQLVYDNGIFFNFEGKTSGLQNLQLENAFKSIPIKYIERPIQDKVVDVLDHIEKKIALSNEINRNLEQLARQLYDYWFVQFDFPNSEGKPYKSSGGEMVWNEKLKRNIPKDWKVVALDSLIDDSRGISYNGSMILGSGIPMINLASFNIDGTYKHSGLKYFNGVYSSNKVLKPFDLVMCNTQQTAIDEKKDIIGKAFLIPALFESDVVSSHHVTTIICKSEEIKPFLAYLFNTRHFHKYAAGCCSGTNIMGLDMKNLKKYELEIPSKELLKRFSRLIIDIESQKSINVKKVLCFKKIRDDLLPMLLNGQVNCDLSQN